MKPVIGILSHIEAAKNPLGVSSIGNTYVQSIEKAGGTVILLPCYLKKEDMDTYLQLCDGFLFSGGIDIDPSYYNEDPHLRLGATDRKLDEAQLTFAEKVLEADKPLLGICRGHQVLTVATGGTLYQDLSEHEGAFVKHRQETAVGDSSHKVYIEPDSFLSSIFGKETFVNSFHHQATKEVGPGVRVTAYSADRIPEAIELDSKKFAVGIQWHPEVLYAHGDHRMEPLFAAFINACK